MCCATKNKLLIITICKVPWSHPQRKKTYSHFFAADIFTSTDIEEFLREAACMKEFDHPHVTKLIGKPALLLVPQTTSHSCTIPHSLTYSPPLLSKAVLVQPSLCCIYQHCSFPGLEGVGVCVSAHNTCHRTLVISISYLSHFFGSCKYYRESLAG